MCSGSANRSALLLIGTITKQGSRFKEKVKLFTIESETIHNGEQKLLASSDAPQGSVPGWTRTSDLVVSSNAL